MVMKIDVPVQRRVVPVAPSEERWREMRVEFHYGAAELHDTAAVIRRLEKRSMNLEIGNHKLKQEVEKTRAIIREMIPNILAMRGIACSEKALEEFHSCIDAEVLRQWGTRALTATSEADVFTKGA